MKKIFFLLAVVFSLSSFAQTHVRTETLFSSWTYNNDTIVYVPCKYDYSYILQIEATGLTGTLDGDFYLKHKLSGFNQYTYITQDTALSKYVINSATWVKTFTLDNTYADTLKFEFLNNNITGGTLKAVLKMYPNRD